MNNKLYIVSIVFFVIGVFTLFWLEAYTSWNKQIISNPLTGYMWLTSILISIALWLFITNNKLDKLLKNSEVTEKK